VALLEIEVSGVIRGILQPQHSTRETELRTQPVRVVLEATQAGTGKTKPPVRIFVGSEPSQYRAERIMVWSIEQVRDKSRVYEIYLMKDLVGFNRRLWLTGFTNYRFAIPHFAGNHGRAIYNDVDQIYLSDPAELFDRDIGGHGFMCIANGPKAKVPVDTSVMLIDCARMAPLWTLEASQRGRKNALIKRALAVSGLWGPIEPEWNARDSEYVAGRSKVLHYTALHLQPWRPFPRQFVYQTNPVGHVWLGLEQGADAAGYRPFTAVKPSDRYNDLLASLKAAAGPPMRRESPSNPDLLDEQQMLDRGPYRSLVDACDCRSIQAYQLVSAGAAPDVQQRIVSLTSGPSIACQRSRLPTERDGRTDGVLCRGFLEYLPDEDIGWVLDKLFGDARGFVAASVALDPAAATLADGTHLPLTRRTRDWWLDHFEWASRRHPAVRWHLSLHGRSFLGGPMVRVHQGGRPLRQPPLVWVLAYDKPGHTTQSVGLAEALGWPYEVKQLRFNTLRARLHTWLQAWHGTLGASLIGLRQRASDVLGPPWPDLVIATGWRPARIALWIGRQSQGLARLVGLGRRAGQIVDIFDAVVTCSHFHLPSHPRRIETVLPISQVTPGRLAAATDRWKDLFGDLPAPRVVLLVGGSNEFYRIDADIARRMAEEVKALAQDAGGTAIAVTSRRTGEAATTAFKSVLGAACVHEWRSDRRENPYLGYLALADVLVVTGDSESMLGEAAATEKPLYIYPVPKWRYGLRRILNEWAVRRAFARPLNRRGTIRPQQGLEYLFAKGIATGLLPPPRDLEALHDNLIRHGIARRFGAPFDLTPRSPLHETDAVAREIRRRMGYPDPDPQPEAAREAGTGRDGLRR
jgi:mitochondrial fission protein ELM1